MSVALVSACGGGDGDGDTGAADANSGGFPDAGDIADGSTPDPDAPPFIGPDASPSALACAGDPLPTTVASPPIVISGEVQEGSTSGVGAMTQSAHVSAHLRSDDSVLVEGDFTGAFSLTDPDSSTTPIDAYLKAKSQDFVDTYVYPPAAISENLSNTPIIMVSNTIYGLLPFLTGVTQESGNGVLIIATVDCDQQNVEGATVSISPDVGTLKYAGSNGIPGMTNYPSTQASGIAYVFNVPPGDYTVSASKGGTDFRNVVFESFADSNTTGVIAP